MVGALRRALITTVFFTAFLAGEEIVSAPATAAPGWNTETLDYGNSTGNWSSTTYYPVFEQHHVFNQGMEAGTPVLRHGWFQPGFSSWKFETLDAGISTGTDTVTVVYGNQHHVFTQGLIDPDFGITALRHGWFDPSVGVWQFETLDEMVSSGSSPATAVFIGHLEVFNDARSWLMNYPGIRHGWYDGTWHFESLDGALLSGEEGSSGLVNAAAVAPDGNLNVFSYGWSPGSQEMPVLRHGWFDPAVGVWQFERFSLYHPQVALASFNGHFEVFLIYPDFPEAPALYHAWWDGQAWHWEWPGDLPSQEGATWDLRIRPSATAYPMFGGQLHAFYAAMDGATEVLRHVWFSNT